MRFFNFGEIVGEYTGKLNKNIMNLTKEQFKKLAKKTLSIADVSSSFYSDCNDYSHLKVNSDQFPEHEECVMWAVHK